MKFPGGPSAFYSLTFISVLICLIPVDLYSQNNKKSDIQHEFVINLDEEEIQWINEHKRIRVGGPKSFPPFHSYNTEGIPEGIASEYIDIILEKLGIEQDVQPNLPWPEVLRRSREKELDLITCSAKSAEREEYLLFTNPHLSFPLVIISRNDSPFISGLKDLTNIKVALLKQNVISEWLKQDGIQVIPYPADSPLDALKAVSTGSAEAYIGNLATCSFLINEYGLMNLKVASPTKYGNYNLYIGVRNDWPELVSILNKGLSSISPEQHAAIRNHWLSIKYEFGITPGDIIRTILIVAGIAAVIFLIFLRWNRLLVQEIKTRKKTELELKKAFEEIKTLSGLLPICSNCKNIRDDKGYWKKIESYFEDHTDVSFSHSLCPDCAEKLYGNEGWYHFQKKSDENVE